MSTAAPTPTHPFTHSIIFAGAFEKIKTEAAATNEMPQETNVVVLSAAVFFCLLFQWRQCAKRATHNYSSWLPCVLISFLPMLISFSRSQPLLFPLYVGDAVGLPQQPEPGLSDGRHSPQEAD